MDEIEKQIDAIRDAVSGWRDDNGRTELTELIWKHASYAKELIMRQRE